MEKKKWSKALLRESLNIEAGETMEGASMSDFWELLLSCQPVAHLNSDVVTRKFMECFSKNTQTTTFYISDCFRDTYGLYFLPTIGDQTIFISSP